MNQKYLAFGIAAVAAYYYFSTKTSATAQKVPLLSSLYIAGYNVGAGNGFSFTLPTS
jgi:hypothetical protein